MVRTALMGIVLICISTAVRADGDGAATIDPSGAVCSGSRGTWTLTHVAGPEGLRPEGSIRIAFSGFPVGLFETPQCEDPAGPAYTTAHCGDLAVPVHLTVDRSLRGGWQNVQEVVVRVGAPGLAPGQTVHVIYGDTSGGGPGGQVRVREGDDLPVRVYSDTDGDGKAAPLRQFPTVTVIGGSTAAVAVCAPSQALVGEPTLVSVSARDVRNDLASEYPPTVTLTSDSLAAPVEVAFPADPPGVAQAQVVFTRPGVHRLTARTPGSGKPPVVISSPEFISVSRPAADTEPTFVPELL